MESQKIINMLDKEVTERCKFRTKKWAEKIMMRAERTAPLVRLNLRD